MDYEIFKNRNEFPDLLQDLAHESTLEAMTPGDITWTVPWALRVDDQKQSYIDKRKVQSNHSPGGTAQLKIVRDFDGIYIDVTALSREDIGLFMSDSKAKSGFSISEESFVPVDGVLYPILEDTRGVNPQDARAFNQEQRGVHRAFKDYFKRTYGCDYVMASDEVRGNYQGGRTGREVVGRTDRPDITLAREVLRELESDGARKRKKSRRFFGKRRRKQP